MRDRHLACVIPGARPTASRASRHASVDTSMTGRCRRSSHLWRSVHDTVVPRCGRSSETIHPWVVSLFLPHRTLPGEPTRWPPSTSALLHGGQPMGCQLLSESRSIASRTGDPAGSQPRQQAANGARSGVSPGWLRCLQTGFVVASTSCLVTVGYPAEVVSRPSSSLAPASRRRRCRATGPRAEPAASHSALHVTPWKPSSYSQ